MQRMALRMMAACVLSTVALAAPLIDLPHSYYYNEMYLPQLTAGPSALAWSPDSTELVYSMGGNLWRQRIDSGLAKQLTDGPGQDYQPDWSPDGRHVVYVRREGEGTELWLLDLASGRSTQLTHDAAVAVEPRFSPDGTRIAWVSTAYNRHFHVFVANFHDATLEGVTRLTGENRSDLPRYYYSAFDHEINPTWTRDGRQVVFVSNRGRIHGTGGIWRMDATPGAPATELHYEETNWEARPEFSPDGNRLVYSSYLGRGALQLWMMPGAGGEPFPISYGEWDETSPRWSPDGRWIASISNRTGDTRIRLLRFPGGDTHELDAAQRSWMHPVATLHVIVRDEQGRVTPARLSVTAGDGRPLAPAHAWMQHAEFDRGAHPFDARYFHSAGEETLEVPAGRVTVEAFKGPLRASPRRELTLEAGSDTRVELAVPARPWGADGARHWVSADLHVHMNYGGHYRNTPAHLVLQAQAEDLDIVHDVIVNKEQRIPDIAYSGHGVDAASTADALVVHGQEFHTSYWGHLGLVGLSDHVLLPGYAGYPNTAAASLYPSNADVADMAHAQGALVGYAHPYEEEPEPLTHPVHTDADELPVDVALGKTDYLEVVGFADHQVTAGVWYRLLNLGFHLPAGAGTDAMADYATLRGPVGLNRVYVPVPPGPLDSRVALESLRAGRSFATNGPLLDLELGGEPVGGTLMLDAVRQVAYTARLYTPVALDHAQLVCNGRVVRELGPARGGLAPGEARFSGKLPLAASGWCLLRAYSDGARYPILDNLAYATTSPVYVSLRGQRARSPADARYFIAWIEHLRAATAAYPDWNSVEEKSHVLGLLDESLAVYRGLE